MSCLGGRIAIFQVKRLLVVIMKRWFETGAALTQPLKTGAGIECELLLTNELPLFCQTIFLLLFYNDSFAFILPFNIAWQIIGNYRNSPGFRLIS